MYRTKHVDDDLGSVLKLLTVSKQLRSVLTVNATEKSQIDSFHQQETERYKTPERGFEYNFNGSTVAVAPLRRAANSLVRAREHFCLKADRPSVVNILCVVRDAAARMPGGVGTRSDVVSINIYIYIQYFIFLKKKKNKQTHRFH